MGEGSRAVGVFVFEGLLQVKGRINHMTARMKSKKGFTLAELLIVIAIIGILAGFGFVQVAAQQRRLKLKEADEIAKEIFMASQNYLKASWVNGELSSKMADSLLPADYFGTRVADEGDVFDAVSYADRSNGTRSSEEKVIGQLLLPFGSIDESVRMGGSYLIRYDRATTTILDVFYSENGDGITGSGDTTYSSLKSLTAKSKEERIQAARASSGNYIGYYGGENVGTIERGSEDAQMAKTSIIVHNKENLWVEIVDPNYTAFNSFVEVTYNGLQSGNRITRRLLRENETTTTVTTEFEMETDYCKLYKIDDYGIYFILIDSITAGKDGHFGNRFPGFIPGENINISATVKSNRAGQQIEATSQTFSSLFAGETMPNGSDYTAVISNGRHLQNLTQSVSKLNFPKPDAAKSAVMITEAELDGNITWDDRNGTIGGLNTINEHSFWGEIATEKTKYTLVEGKDSLFEQWTDGSQVCKYDGSGLSNQSFLSIDPGFSLTGTGYSENSFSFSGNGYSLKDFTIMADTTIPDVMGVFGKVPTGYTLTLKDILLENPYVQSADNSSASAGGLVGENLGTLSITNCGARVTATTIFTKELKPAGDREVMVYTNQLDVLVKNDNTKDLLTETARILAGEYEGGAFIELKSTTDASAGTNNHKKASAAGRRIYSANGSAGGLVGKSTGTLTLTKCFASIPVAVAAEGNAGGLVGSVEGTTSITGCFTGGHTKDGMYVDTCWNIASQTNGTAGGLVGDVAGTVNIANSYSTCSVLGDTAGGLIGKAVGSGSITNCYATGRVAAFSTTNSTVIGSFAGSSNLTVSNDYYYEIIEETVDNHGNVTYLPAVAGSTQPAGIKAIDKDVETYEAFVGAARGTAQVYDGILITYLADKYALKTVGQLGEGSVVGTDYVSEHIGDWPAPELLVVNTPS